MHTPLFELYRDSLYCNAEKQQLPRPSNWYSTKLSTEVIKFRWVQHSDIAFESSYRSVHNPLPCCWQNANTMAMMRHDKCNRPFGVHSFVKDNALYWRNCAKNYLIAYSIELSKIKEFQSLIDNLAETEDVPSHWVEIVSEARRALDVAMQKFKTCRMFEKTNFGLISSNDLPVRIRSEIIALSRLSRYLRAVPHNSLIAYQSVENFYSDGFRGLATFAHVTTSDIEPALNGDHDTQFKILVAYLKERMTKPIYKENEQKIITDVQLAIAFEAAMQYYLSFGKDYGSMKHLSSFKRLAERYKDIVDVTLWFKNDNPAYA
ncbi:hypothetical protein [Vibrio fluvialis]|uniref:hypothetical protein n=1 Tax=Vibrio fluvialis TaxID=676 RepID=UPI0023A92285|nr:hypothetical protein [Vibrio fluvialis]MDE5179201.1 hypothetical protein [Vibrio fluvialis]